jgi:Flp pilus assembly protein TadG
MMLRALANLIPHRKSLITSDQSGAAALEFALVATPLMLMLLGGLQLAFMFLISSTLSSATTSVARQIRTQQYTASGATAQTDFGTQICDRMGWLQSTCAGSIWVDVETAPSFTAASSINPVSGGAFNSNSLGFSASNAGQIVLVKAYYLWPIYTPILYGPLHALSNGKVVISATSAFRNEP